MRGSRIRSSGRATRTGRRVSRRTSGGASYEKPKVVHAEQSETSVVGSQSGDDATCSGVPESKPASGESKRRLRLQR